MTKIAISFQKRLRLAATEDFGFAPTEQHVRRVFRSRVAALSPLFAQAERATPDCSGADDAFAVLRASHFLAQHGDTYRTRPAMLGSNIRAARMERGWSQEQLAEYATLHRTYIVRVEGGLVNVSIDAIEAIAAALGVTAARLVADDSSS